jgi:dihydropteroate synthase
LFIELVKQTDICILLLIRKNTISRAMCTINFKGKIIDLSSPIVMGILNITPDSFYKGYLDHSHEDILGLARNMIIQGATILDIGGQSTRPGSIRVAAEEEIKRVIPVIETLHKHFPEAILSIDTYYSEVAGVAVQSGVSIVNDISAGELDNNMISTVGHLNVPYIAMHMKGTPETMQHNPEYNNVVKEVIEYFIQKKQDCLQAGIKDIILDPGFGFGKTNEHNYMLLRELSALNILDCPILAGISRKGMIYKTIGVSASEALNGTTVANTMALMNGAKILRVHDVKEAVEAITIFNAYKNAAL